MEIAFADNADPGLHPPISIGSPRVTLMAHYIVSDIHLHEHAPGASAKLAKFVDSLSSSDTLIIGGDLCDFWYSTRQRDGGIEQCVGLTALRRFRDRGGKLILIAGNHDAYLEDYYQRWLGVGFTPEPLLIDHAGTRVHLVHGHLVGPLSPLKALVGGKLFHAVFSWLPSFVADRLRRTRVDINTHNEDERCAKFLAAFRNYIRNHPENEEHVFVFGHVHEFVDEPVDRSRMIVLGDWEFDISYVRLDDRGAELIRTAM